jgi:uncharacterized repeat protein (TIGR03803 family)
MTHLAFSRKLNRDAMTLALLLVGLLSLSSMAAAQTVNIIGNTAYTLSSVIFDSAGNIYGTTNIGGTSTNCHAVGCGTVFELSPTSSGSWTLNTIYTFNGEWPDEDTDGAWPSAGLVIDSKGRLFGTTGLGGNYTCACGTVYMLSPTSSGSWKETVIYRFSGPDGMYPYTGLLLDSKGNLYGTTSSGGAFNQGTLFMLSPTSAGWKESVLYSFTGKADGAYPLGIAFDAAGDIIGNTEYGPNLNTCGEMFKLSRSSSAWTETNLYNFTGTNGDGCEPGNFFSFDTAGRLWGTTYVGGNNNQGTVFTLTHSSGVWKESVLYRFTGGNDGGVPDSIAISPSGEVFGFTNYGAPNGCSNIFGCGQIFKLSHDSTGWKVSDTYTAPLQEPSFGGLTFDKSGNLYGTNVENQYQTDGHVFELTP